jgi:hypothetical protein
LGIDFIFIEYMWILAGLIVSNRDPITSASTVILKASGELFVSKLFVGELYCR